MHFYFKIQLCKKNSIDHDSDADDNQQGGNGGSLRKNKK